MKIDTHKVRILGGYWNPVNSLEFKNILSNAISQTSKNRSIFGFLTIKILLGGPRKLENEYEG